MSLPKIDKPLFELKVPSTNKILNFRPYLVKEEKILLIAQQSGTDNEIIKAIKQVINNCCQQELNIDSLTTFDMEYLFLKLRSRSVNNIVKLSYRDTEDNEVYNFELDLEKIEVEFPKNIDAKIEITNTVGLQMKYPSANIVDKMTHFENEVQLLTYLISCCIDTIYDEETVYTASEYSIQELSEFLDKLDVGTFEKIKNFIENMPKLQHIIEYENKNGNKRKIELNNLKDFFSWG